MGRPGGVIFFSRDDYDLYKCIELFCLIREYHNLASVTQKQVKRLQAKVQIGKYKNKFGLPTFQTIAAIEANTNLRIKIWTKKKNNWKERKPVITLFREPFDHGESVKDTQIIHIYGPDVSRKSFSTKNLALIYDHHLFFTQPIQNIPENTVRLRKTLFQAVVLQKYKNLAGLKFEQKVQALENQWGKEFLEISEIKRFRELYKIGLEVWSFAYKKEKDRKRRYSVCQYRSPHKENIAIELEDFEIDQPIPLKMCLTYIPDIAKMDYFVCKTKNCYYGSSRKYNFDLHVASCNGEPKMVCNQLKIEAPENHARKSLAREGVLPSADFQNFYYAVYDVEALMSPSIEYWENFSQIHRLATIAVVSRLDRENDEKFFYRRDMKPSSLKKLIEEFWEYLEETRKRMHTLLPETIHTGYMTLLDFRKTELFKKATPEQKALINKKIEILRKIRTLRVYAWNGARYDSNLIVSPLVEYFSKNEEKFSNMSVIKKNSGYMHIAYDGIHLLGN